MKSLSPSPTPELLAANQRLHQLRQQKQTNSEKLDQPEAERAKGDDTLPWEESAFSKAVTTVVDLVTKLPAHLGWGSPAVTISIHASLQSNTKVEHLTADHPPSRPISDRSHSDGQPSDFQSRATAGKQLFLPLCKKTVKHYPTIGIAALKEEQSAIYRVWLICRYLDRDGRGWLAVQDVREQLTNTEAKLRLFTWRRLRQVLAQGCGRFWIWDKEHDRLWLFGAARVATNLNVTRLVGKPVALPISVINKSIGEFKAHLYGAWHSGWKTNNPISRVTQEMITSIPERTQRHYCQVAGIERKNNIAIGNKHNPEEVENQAWQRGRATFEFADHQGRQGYKGTSYVA